MVKPLFLVPDRMFTDFSEITPALLRAENIRGLVIDIDYTLAPKSVGLPDDDVKRLIRALHDAGFGLCILSNNHRGRVSVFAQALGIPFICNGMKPFPYAFRRAVRLLGLSRGEVAAVGDQIYTDVFGAHASGLKAWMVLPKGSGSSAFYRFRRRLETPFVSRYRRREEAERTKKGQDAE